MPRPNVPPEPKPFFRISLDPKRPPDKERPTMHQRFEDLSGRLVLEIEVCSAYFYVGSGLLELDTRQRTYYTFARHNNQLVIPATGMKGAVRSVVEAISNSCVPQTTRDEGVPRSHRPCQETRQEEVAQVALCPACRLFGTTGYRGRLHFSDAAPLGEVRLQIIKIADLWPPRQGKDRKFYQAKTFQRSDDETRPEKNHRFLEAVPKGTRFTTTLFFENISLPEMGLVVRGLGLAPHAEKESSVVHAFPIKLGGAKPRCLGAVYFHPRSIHLLPTSSEGLFQALVAGGQGKPVRETLSAWLEDEALLDTEAWKAFCQKAKVKPELCPKELY